MPPRDDWQPLLDRALAEDIGSGDLTSELSVDAERTGRARIEARQRLVVCGLTLAEAVFHAVDPGLEIVRVDDVADGAWAEAGQPLLRILGSYRSILTAERTALNFLGRLCGIATQTRGLVDRVSDLPVELVDTRKTTPGWRRLEKYAVATGGGVNHRVGLFDAVLVKDNHIAAAGGLETAVQRVLDGTPPGVRVQIEVESEEMAQTAVDLGCDFLLLDNLPPETIRRIVERFAPNVTLEASGGIGPQNLRDYAETGVDRISMGALTHSVPSADLALEIDLLPTATGADA
ncbi:MAG: carboxylating nicotinate-nucleotide diphosphorylase [Deltaproteobacteria bacterium]|jgi:nicotinate-nucleotide pyrophosphorylase (carboxylating)|nr:carboxylating nicotinate-nucleotide diphosphorylase [Deltaproteobacteria bacterium]